MKTKLTVLKVLTTDEHYIVIKLDMTETIVKINEKQKSKTL